MSSPHVLDRGEFRDCDTASLGDGHLRRDVDSSGAPIYGFIINDSTCRPVPEGFAILGLHLGGARADSTGRYFFLAPRGSHELAATALGYSGDTVWIVVDSLPVRAGFELKGQFFVLGGPT